MKRISILIAAILISAACDKDIPRVDAVFSDEPYIEFDQPMERLSFSVGGGKKSVQMYSNQGPWVIEPAFEGDGDWITVWPREGDRNGRFTITVEKNTGARNRTAQMNIVIDSKPVYSFDVSQIGSEPSILLDMGSDRVSASASGGEIEIGIIANTIWKTMIPAEAESWITPGEHGDDFQKLVIARNEGGQREARIRFQAVGTTLEGVYTEIILSQFDASKDPSNGTKITIADIYTRYPEGTTVISENLWTEATVTSDPAKLNFEPVQMFVQDASGRGMRFDFNSAKENNAPLNARIKIHLYGLRVVKNALTGQLYITGASASTIFERTENAEPVTPIDVTDISDLDAWQNTLVRLKDVSFVLPFGNYVNIDNRYYSWVNPTYLRNSSAEPYCDGDDFAGQMLIDRNAHTARIYCRSQFLDRFSRVIPKGCGDVVGIVTRDFKSDAARNIVLIRSDRDNMVTDEAGDCLFNTLTRIGPITSITELPKVMSSDGRSQIKTTWTEGVAALGTTNGVAMDYGWSYMRKSTAEVTLNADGTQDVRPQIPNTNADSPAVMYGCISAQHFWNYTGSTMNRTGALEDERGEAWVFPVSGLVVDPSKPLYLVFTTAASQTGPMYFDIEWNADENADMPSFKANRIGSYICPDWYSGHQMEQFFFRLPDELKTLGSFVIRFRVTKNWRAGNGMTNGAESATSIATGGSPRIGIWEIIQMK